MIRCTRCARRLRNADGWNTIFRMGVLTGYLCPSCQTPEENSEAEINDATLDYSTMTLDAIGRACVKSKAMTG